MVINVDNKRKGLPALKVSGRLVSNAVFVKRYFCQHSQKWKSIFEVIEDYKEAKPVEKKVEAEASLDAED